LNSDFWTKIEDFMAGIMGVINALLVPMDTTGVVDWTNITAVQIMIWFGLVFMFVPLVFGFIVKMIRSGKGAS
jgi:hypothetical protein